MKTMNDKSNKFIIKATLIFLKILQISVKTTHVNIICISKNIEKNYLVLLKNYKNLHIYKL
jgi:hypothetical protein